MKDWKGLELLKRQELVSCLLIEIEDQGIGIPPEDCHRIF
ncbi:MAG: ATP-binding protein [Lachnospiraceae bacterium]|nr:ATP-binding protein [Lachnospiraceae bacterium]